MSEGRLKLAIGLTSVFIIVEAIAGARANSLALLSDAGHNFTDALALALSWYAVRVAQRPATASKTFGYHRVGVLTALFNAVTLLVIAALIFREAYDLFFNPQPVASGLMIGVAAVAFLLNTTIALGLRGEAAHSVNMRGAFIHMAGDALSSLGVVAAGVAIHFTGWAYADPLVALLIGAFIVYSSWGILTETVHVLLESAPRGLDVEAMIASVQSVPGVSGVHDLHVWTIADGMNALSCHLRIAPSNQRETARVVQEVKGLLGDRYALWHSTIETECADEEGTTLLCSLPCRPFSRAALVEGALAETERK